MENKKGLGKVFEKHFKRRKKTAIQKITDSLIEKQFGKKGELRKVFEKNIEGYNPEDRPIGEEDAKRILAIMLNQVANSRHFLSMDIGESVAGGEMYEFYAKKQEEILNLSLDAITKKQNLIAAHEEYNRMNDIYLQVVSKSVKSEYHHAPAGKSAEEKFRETQRDFSQTNNADETTAKLNEDAEDKKV